MVECDEQTAQNHLAMAEMEGDEEMVMDDQAGKVEQQSVMEFSTAQTGTYNNQAFFIISSQ